jgi:AraC-like DNA-binding protein
MASPNPAPPPLDLMSELLLGMRLRGVQYRRIEVAPPFGLGFGDASSRAHLHVVVASDIRDCAGKPDCPANTIIFSSCMEFDLGGMQRLVHLMPEVMIAGTLSERHPEVLPILKAMESEVCGRRVGFAGILGRLADVLSAIIVRGWVECGCDGASGLVDALRDPRLAGAIGALHRDPGRNWTVADLAAETGSSRSVFAERFHGVTGVTPLRYAAELRMRLAMQWIGSEQVPIDAVAHRLGYASQAAFSRAFKRVTGRSPGLARLSQQHPLEASRSAVGTGSA